MRSVWDWGTGAKLCVGAWRRAWGRISALEYLNAHAAALLCVASANGHCALYRPGASAQEPALLAAWRALDARPAPDYRPPPAQPLYGEYAAPSSRVPSRRDSTSLVPGSLFGFVDCACR